MVQRGFKTKARNLALEVRDEVGIGPHDPLDVYALAELYGLRIVDLSRLRDFGCHSESLDYFLNDGSHSFSAAVLPIGRAHLIIVNDCHAPARQKSSVAHELAHVLLEHDFPGSICTDSHCRAYDSESEEQAHLLGGELLIPTVAAHRLAAYHVTDRGVAQVHGVSERFAKMRMDESGGRLRARRGAARRPG
ncbi:MAG TPA: ImmA/IrrE family metallo-endopeptidase [Acidimicrobiales bacterium]|nr:ImmA/IrrE family metallo-endopeptidase [Acidimicrobiales bacterium]